ncbi:predicted protein [Postia placenta Mad-698-R]|nr:predicted protein [Postia placenta Mad-698-R]
MSKKSIDPEFEDYARRFTSIEDATEKLIKDTKAYTESVSKLFTHGAQYAQHFATVFHPMPSEYNLEGKHPEAEHTIQNVDAYEAALQELKSALAPELELIESRILGPAKELQGVMKMIRKTITKREHKASLHTYSPRHHGSARQIVLCSCFPYGSNILYVMEQRVQLLCWNHTPWP